MPGLKPFKSLKGNLDSGDIIECIHKADDSATLGIGDPVIQDTDGNEEDRPVVTRASAGGRIYGVVVGVKPDTDESTTYVAASTLRTVFVQLAEGNLWIATEDGDGGYLAATNVGNHADIATVAACNTTTGLSTVVIDSSTASNSAAQLHIIKMHSKPGNTIGTTSTEWVVRINENQFGDDSAGV